MSHFRQKPVVVEAFQWDGTIASCDAIQRWAGMEPRGNGTYRDRVEQLTQFGPICVHLPLDGRAFAQAFDWVVKGIDGQLFPCTAGVFATLYEPVSSDTPPIEGASDAR